MLFVRVRPDNVEDNTMLNFLLFIVFVTFFIISIMANLVFVYHKINNNSYNGPGDNSVTPELGLALSYGSCTELPVESPHYPWSRQNHHPQSGPGG